MIRAFRALIATAFLTVPILLPAQTNNAAPLPPLKLILTRAAEAVNKEDYYHDTFNQRYAYHRSRVTETRYSNGRFKEKQEKYNTNSPSIDIASQPLPEY